MLVNPHLERVQVHEGGVLQLRLKLPNSHAMCEGGENVQGLPGYLLLLRRLHVPEGSHIVEAVGCGERG